VARRRPTPLDPFPEPRAPEEERQVGDYPPELGSDAIAVLEGRTFMYSDPIGDVPPGSTGGLLHDDTRFVSGWTLTLDGRRPSLLKSAVVDYYSAAFFLTNPDIGSLRANTIAIRRVRFVGGGVHEQIAMYNAASDPIKITVRLEVQADFADLFEVKSMVRDRSRWIDVEHDPDIPLLHFHYERDGFLAETNVQVTRTRFIPGARVTGEGTDAPGPAIDGDAFSWDLEIPARTTFVSSLRVTVRVNETVLEPMHEEFGEQRELAEGALTMWLDEVPRFSSGDPLLSSVIDKSIIDLAALRIAGEIGGERYVLPAAGLPWFMTLFGRDTLITSLQALWVGPELARGALRLLGALQGRGVNDFKDEEPGRILHEVRDGELTVTGEMPYSPYYGTSDATPLYLVLLSEYWRWSGDDEFVRSRWDTVRAALGWIDEFGDRDGDGYVEYQTRSSRGLGNQCWRDSWDGVQFSDGRLPYLPIATAEIQGYVFDAKLRIAEIAERLMRDAALAERLRTEASTLRDRFNEDFWNEGRGGYYVLGLDGDKAQIDSMTSSMGHLLWSGIVPDERARTIAGHLMSSSMYSGWGVRTLSNEDAGYNPIGYHTGTVWPHDNAIVALGLMKAGFRDEANRIALDQLEAASYSGFRLPEVFAGLTRDAGRFPVPYPTACSPQAWATGAPFFLVKAMLGLDAREGRLELDPAIPEKIGRIRIHGMHAFGAHVDVEASGTEGEARPTT
jgi:glycogen debranching enzyme